MKARQTRIYDDTDMKQFVTNYRPHGYTSYYVNSLFPMGGREVITERRWLYWVNLPSRNRWETVVRSWPGLGHEEPL